MAIPTTRRYYGENESFAPINALEEESAAVAQNARELEQQLDAIIASSPSHLRSIEDDESLFYDRGHSAIRAAAYLGWKTAEQSAHVVQAAGGVLGCAMMLRMIVALRREERIGDGSQLSLRPAFARGWHTAYVRDERSETEDERRAGDDDDDETKEFEEIVCYEDEDETDRGRLPNAVWWTTLEGFDWWSVRTAQAKARSHIAHALAKGLVAFRAMYGPLEEVTIANWDLREILQMFEHADPMWLRSEADVGAASRLALAAGEACGAVRRLLREVRRIVALLHVALLGLTSTDDNDSKVAS